MSGLLKSISSITIAFFMLISMPAMVFAEDHRTAVAAVEVLNLRQNPTVSATILCKLPKGEQVLIADERDGWYKVTVPVNGKELTGWVMGQYVSLDSNEEQEGAAEEGASKESTTQQALVKGTINLVNASVLGATKINKINAGTINVLGGSTSFAIRTGTISVISVNPGGAGTTGLDPANSSAAGIGPAGSSPDGSSPDAIGPDAEKLIAFAKSLLGIPYVYGGMSPAGFDCSGFTSYVFGAFGIKLERVSTDQAKQGMEISKENLKPGDLVFFDTNGGNSDINHAGIFIGDGKFIHASSGTSYCVIISDLTTGYYTGNFMTARRIYQTP